MYRTSRHRNDRRVLDVARFNNDDSHGDGSYPSVKYTLIRLTVELKPVVMSIKSTIMLNRMKIGFIIRRLWSYSNTWNLPPNRNGDWLSDYCSNLGLLKGEHWGIWGSRILPEKRGIWESSVRKIIKYFL